MKLLIQLVYYFFIALLAVSKTGGVKSLMAENMLLRQQLITLNRSRKRAPKLTIMERLSFAFLTGLIHPHRLKNIGIIIKPSTLFKLHKALIKRKYRLLFSNKSAKKPGPKGPSQELIDAIIAMKQRNPRYGCQRIAMQINNIFGFSINKDVVRRVLAKHYRPAGGDGPSWLTFIGHMTDNLWSVDFFRAESILLTSHWVMVVMEQFT